METGRATPTIGPGTTSLADREYPTVAALPASPLEVIRRYDIARRQRLLRLLAVGVAIITGVLIPSTFFPVFDGISFIGLSIVFLGALAAYIINRLQWMRTASYLLLGSAMVGIAWVISARAVQGGLTPTDLRLYDFFVLPIIVFGILANRRAPFYASLLTGAFTTLSLFLLPHSQSLQLYWDGRDPQTLGSVYDVIAIPLVIQGLTAVAAWLGADSVRRSLLSATQADELAMANARILAQANELALQRRQLHDGIVHMQHVHTTFARGNFDVRARIAGEELQPLAVSLNYLLTQMQRLLREQAQRTRIESAAHELALALRRARSGGPYMPPQYTGTTFDEVLLELVTWFQRGSIATPGEMTNHPFPSNSSHSSFPSFSDPSAPSQPSQYPAAHHNNFRPPRIERDVAGGSRPGGASNPTYPINPGNPSDWGYSADSANGQQSSKRPPS